MRYQEDGFLGVRRVQVHIEVHKVHGRRVANATALADGFRRRIQTPPPDLAQVQHILHAQGIMVFLHGITQFLHPVSDEVLQQADARAAHIVNLRAHLFEV